MSHKWMHVVKTFGTITVELVVLFLAVSFLVALIQRRVGEERLQRWMGGGKYVAPAKGVALGAITPFCSCSTLPMLMGMIKAKTPFTGAAAFLLASPLLDPIIFGVIWILFDWRVMTIYAVVTFVLVYILSIVWGQLGMEQYVRRVRVTADGHDTHTPWLGFRKEAGPAWSEAKSFFKPLIIPMSIGVGVGAFIYGVVPQSFLIHVAGPGSLLAVPIAALVGIPLYVRTETILPIGLALSSAGMGLGPVFALVIGGAGASIPEVSMLSAIFKPRLVALFVGSVFTVAVVGGILIPLA